MRRLPLFLALLSLWSGNALAEEYNVSFSFRGCVQGQGHRFTVDAVSVEAAGTGTWSKVSADEGELIFTADSNIGPLSGRWPIYAGGGGSMDLSGEFDARLDLPDREPADEHFEITGGEIFAPITVEGDIAAPSLIRFKWFVLGVSSPGGYYLGNCDEDDATAHARPSTAVTPCFSSHVFGGFNYCISEHGNVASLESPAGHEHLSWGNEGYVLCDLTGGVNYYDLADLGEAGWEPATTTIPGVLPFVVTRTTSDGIWTLRQEFNRLVSERKITIDARIKNNSAVPRSIQISRAYDANMDGSDGGDIFDRTPDSVTAKEVYGLMLSTTSHRLPHDTFVQPFSGLTSSTCSPTTVSTPTAPGDFAGTLRHGSLTVKPGKVAKVNVEYKRY